MSSSIDLATIGLGMAIGYGLRKEIRSTAGVCRNALLGAVAAAAATTVAQQAEQADQNNGGKKDGN